MPGAKLMLIVLARLAEAAVILMCTPMVLCVDVNILVSEALGLRKPWSHRAAVVFVLLELSALVVLNNFKRLGWVTTYLRVLLGTLLDSFPSLMSCPFYPTFMRIARTLQVSFEVVELVAVSFFVSTRITFLI